ncbi:hypothetical protein BSKO_03300 [Bryopsis sp. KO-2023]|nr:hypothetical protein BSKO_03300 [Bryopsis sp. KO-2023]
MDEAISQFADITGASPSVAQYYLEACNGDIENAIHQYLENPTDEGPMDALPQPVRTDIDMTIPDVEELECNPSPQVSPVGSFGMGRPDGLEDDGDLQKALEESLRAQGNASFSEDVEIVESPRGAGGSAAAPGPFQPTHVEDVSGVPNLLVEGHAISPSRIQSPPPDRHVSDVGGTSDSPRFPSDVNREEAEMLEAAFFGVPYNGRMTDYPPPRSPSPETKARRVIIDDQEKQYNESLQADKEKAEVAARADREAQEMERHRREAEVAEARRKEEEQAALEQIIAAKKSTLPQQPSESTADTITIMIRLPDGSKLSRRFELSNPLQVVFDFVDVEMAGKGGDLTPGSYNLLRQFPKVVYEPNGDRGSLKAEGLTDEALFAVKRD